MGLMILWRNHVQGLWCLLLVPDPTTRMSVMATVAIIWFVIVIGTVEKT